jgi:hypothetical protein
LLGKNTAGETIGDSQAVLLMQPDSLTSVRFPLKPETSERQHSYGGYWSQVVPKGARARGDLTLDLLA